MDDIVAGLQDVTREVQRIARSLRAVEETLPEEVSGWDATSTVSVQVGRGGEPVGISVEQGWASALEPERLSGAILEAALAATAARWADAGKIMATGLPLPEGDEPAPTVTAPTATSWTGPERSLEELAEMAIAGLRESAALVAEPPATPVGAGEAAHGRVRVELSAGTIRSCSIDTAWAAGRSGIELSTALNQAVAGARDALRTATEAGALERSRARTDDLVAQALAFLAPASPAADPVERNRDV